MSRVADRLDVSEQVTDLLDWRDDDMPAVFLSATVGSAAAGHAPTTETFQVLQAVAQALKHERLMQRIARRADLDPDRLLELLLGQFEHAAMRPQGATFSDSDRRALSAAGVDLAGPPEHAIDPAELSASRYTAMFGEALRVAAAARLLSVTPGRVRQRLADRTLHGIRGPRSEWRLPCWQFRDGAALPGLEAVLPALPAQLHPLAVEGFMTGDNVDLVIDRERVVSPIEWLASGGDSGAVAELARLLPTAS